MQLSPMELFARNRSYKFTIREASEVVPIVADSIKNWVRFDHIQPELGKSGQGKTQYFTLRDIYEIAITARLAQFYIRPEITSNFARYTRKLFRDDLGVGEGRDTANYLVIYSHELHNTLECDIHYTDNPVINEKGYVHIIIPLQKLLNEIDRKLEGKGVKITGKASQNAKG